MQEIKKVGYKKIIITKNLGNLKNRKLDKSRKSENIGNQKQQEIRKS